MVNINEINNAADAKEQLYGNNNIDISKLPESFIFDNSKISKDISKTRKTAEILDKVFTAKWTNSRNDKLLEELENHMINDYDCCEAINSLGNYKKIEEAINNLQRLKDGLKTEAEIRRLINEKELEINFKELEIEETKKTKNEGFLNSEEYQKIKLEEIRRQEIVEEAVRFRDDILDGTFELDDNAMEISANYKRYFNQTHYYWEANFDNIDDSIKHLLTDKQKEKRFITKENGGMVPILGQIIVALQEFDRDEFVQALTESTLEQNVERPRAIELFELVKASSYSLMLSENPYGKKTQEIRETKGIKDVFQVFPGNSFGFYKDEETRKRLEGKIMNITDEDLIAATPDEMLELVQLILNDKNILSPDNRSEAFKAVLNKKRLFIFRALTEKFNDGAKKFPLEKWIIKNRNKKVLEGELISTRFKDVNLYQMFCFAEVYGDNMTPKDFKNNYLCPCLEVTSMNNVALLRFVRKIRKEYPKLSELDDNFLISLSAEVKMGHSERFAAYNKEYNMTISKKDNFYETTEWPESMTNQIVKINVEDMQLDYEAKDGEPTKYISVNLLEKKIIELKTLEQMASMDSKRVLKESEISLVKSKLENKKVSENNIIKKEEEIIVSKNELKVLQNSLIICRDKDVEELEEIIDKMVEGDEFEAKNHSLWDLQRIKETVHELSIKCRNKNNSFKEKYENIYEAIERSEKELLKSESNSLALQFRTLGGNLNEVIEKIISSRDKDELLKKYIDAFEDLGNNYRKLNEIEDRFLKSLKKAQEGTWEPEKEEDNDHKSNDGDSDNDESNEDKLKQVLKISNNSLIDQDLLDEWTNELGELGEDKLKELVNQVYGDKNSFVDYMRSENANLDDWEKIMIQRPEEVIDSIFSYKVNHPDFDIEAVKTEMDDYRDDDKELDKEEYGNGEEYSLEGIKKFLIEKEKKQSHSTREVEEEEHNGDDNNSLWKRWVVDQNYLTLIIPALVVLALSVVFWDKISNWWEPTNEDDETKEIASE
ncbi:hypothetical protein [endosymbiont GvMRE of Glomus versiforme]|uniref:hypothetical protein n=1 Tax=endosymbiont GvMRE of Glomus versiforme TaxID=2039283 RepID=UPI000EE25EFD|nr:hypothetical protein [endosymbiont GvMRE of Glomus versiforme]RHZ35309.1 hypothetical protein GvMRE_IIg142 [endosymbiont GvMRE of Glomus versiforme]